MRRPYIYTPRGVCLSVWVTYRSFFDQTAGYSLVHMAAFVEGSLSVYFMRRLKEEGARFDMPMAVRSFATRSQNFVDR